MYTWHIEPCTIENGRLVNQNSHDPSRFIVCPRSCFLTNRVSSNDLHVEEVGSYSVHGDLEANLSEFNLRADRSLLRPMTIRCGQTPFSVGFRLDDGYEEAARNDLV